MEKTRSDCPTPFQKRICWITLSGICLVVLIALILGGLWGVGILFLALEPVLLPVIIAGILAYLLSPVTTWFQKWLHRRMSAVLLTMGITLLALAGLGAAVIPPLIKQTGELMNNRQQIVARAVETGKDLLETNSIIQTGIDMLYKRVLSDAQTELTEQEPQEDVNERTYPQKLTSVMEYNSSYLTEKALDWVTAGTRAISGATFFLIGAVMVPVFLFYFLLESEQIQQNWHRILPLTRSRFRLEVVETLTQINNYIIAFVRGQMLVSLIDAVLLGIALKIMGLPYAITIAAAAALLGIIPYIGMISTCLPALLIAWFTWGDVGHVAAVAIIFFSISQFDGWVIQPRVVGNRVGMHDMTVMFSVLFWSSVIGGIVGALLAVPLTASIKVLFIRYVWPSLQKGHHGNSELPSNN